MVAPRVQLAQQIERLADRPQTLGQARRRRGGTDAGAPARAAILEQRVVADREQRAAHRAEHRQLVVRPLDRGERRAHRLDLFAIVERLAADEQVRHAARLERLHVGPRHVLHVAAALVVDARVEAAEQQADVARRARRARSSGRSRSVTVQPLCVTSQSTNAPTASGSESVTAFFVTCRASRSAAARAAPRPPAGRRRRRAPAPAARSCACSVAASPVMQRRERGVDRALNRRHATEAGGQLRRRRAPWRAQLRAHLLVDADVGAAEAIDRLLRVADDEQLAGRGRHGAPVAHRPDRRRRAAAGSRPAADRCPGTRRRRGA